ncbi:MAG: hypothetical protein ABIP81_03085, partial [Terriglobales bacterium]
MTRKSYFLSWLLLAVATAALHGQAAKPAAKKEKVMQEQVTLAPAKDTHTYARPDEARVTHVDM